jgi:hypothetical protein
VIDEDVRRFILTSIPSIPHLEALLLVRREPHAEWDEGTLGRRLYIGEKTAHSVLADLAEAGFVASLQEGTAVFRYRPAHDGQAQIVDKVADAYAHDLIEVTNLIHGRSALLFADAFRIRRD